MAKLRTVYRCSECGSSSPKWAGRCPTCEAWNSLTEEVEAARATSAPPMVPADRPVPIGDVDLSEFSAVSTGIPELDRVLGGGLVPGSVTLVGGEPGIGKSTLLLQMAARTAEHSGPVLYISAEESKQQVRSRAARLGAITPDLYLASEQVMANVEAHIQEVKPKLVVLDSIQTVYDHELGSSPGTIVQVRESAQRLVNLAKSTHTSVVLVGHVTKDGGLAGPRVLEHVVDTVLSFEGDHHHALRILRASKHRFGPTQELGLFQMEEEGLESVPDPSSLFLADREFGVPGSVVVPTMDGFRPIMAEIQALASPSAIPTPRRNSQGLGSGRVAMIIAVLEKRVGLSFDKVDVFALAAGGVNVTEPGADLAIALALASSQVDVPFPPTAVACGEIGLAGEIRQVAQTPRRLAEAARLGFSQALVPMSASDERVDGLQVIGVPNLMFALMVAGIAPPSKD